MRLLSLAFLSCFALTPAVAQDVTPPEPKKPTPLFRSQETLNLTITADMKEVASNRDTSKTEWVPAKLGYTENGTASTMDIELSTRGHFRLKSSTCSAPPLRVRFPKETITEGLWDKQGTLKLVTHCRPNYDQNVLQEFMVYRIYNLLTEASFQVRLAKIEYLDTKKPDKPETFWAFFLEDNDDMAKRINGKIFKDNGIGFDMGDPGATGIMSVFFYMVGNTDWSMPFQHNVKIVEQGFNFVPVPYDFDWSGIVNAPYAKPDYRLPIKSVRDRLYRGPCYDQETLAAILDRFKAIRTQVTELYQMEGMEPKKQSEALKYLEDFWKVVDDPRNADRELRQACPR